MSNLDEKRTVCLCALCEACESSFYARTLSVILSFIANKFNINWLNHSFFQMIHFSRRSWRRQRGPLRMVCCPSAFTRVAVVPTSSRMLPM